MRRHADRHLLRRRPLLLLLGTGGCHGYGHRRRGRPGGRRRTSWFSQGRHGHQAEAIPTRLASSPGCFRRSQLFPGSFKGAPLWPPIQPALRAVDPENETKSFSSTCFKCFPRYKRLKSERDESAETRGGGRNQDGSSSTESQQWQPIPSSGCSWEHQHMNAQVVSGTTNQSKLPDSCLLPFVSFVRCGVTTSIKHFSLPSGFRW